MLLLHFTFASGIGGHAGCAEFFLSPIVQSFFLEQVQAGSLGQSVKRESE